MTSTVARNLTANQGSYSSSHLDTSQISSPRPRTSSLQNRAAPLSVTSQTVESPLDDVEHTNSEDIFVQDTVDDGDQSSVRQAEYMKSSTLISDRSDELPIELISLIDRFIESLSAKVYNTPPSIERLSGIFQGFYTKASSHVATHISALSTHQSRTSSPSASTSSKSSQTRLTTKLSSREIIAPAGTPVPEQQMLTPQEISDRRRARRLLDRKGLALEEAVERQVCERVYDRIWRHRSTLDEVRDDKLRSRTAALAVVGIGLQDLGVDMKVNQSNAELNAEVEDWIGQARDGLLRMNNSKNPLGKLQQLAMAHKLIVDMLTVFHQSSSSADEILPTLIYTLIKTPPEGINVISNLNFIQRFRGSNKIDGEAAYCLTNLEAAITFLETVDLASLRSEEAELRHPMRSVEQEATPTQASEAGLAITNIPSAPLVGASPVAASTSTEALVTERDGLSDIDQAAQHLEDKRVAPEVGHKRRVSNLFQPPAAAIGAAGDAVRNTADQGIKGISTALDNSFKLLFGRLGEQKVVSPNPDASKPLAVPKTLDDARKLVEPKSAEEESLLSEVNSIAEKPDPGSKPKSESEDSLLTAITGKKPAQRERSVDSHQSGKHVLSDTSSASNGAIESMRNLGNTFNPLKGLGSMGMMRGFGRTSSSGTPTLATVGASSTEGLPPAAQRSVSPANVVGDGIRTLPPIQRFIDAPSIENLKISDIPELLDDYKRLAEALRTLGAF